MRSMSWAAQREKAKQVMSALEKEGYLSRAGRHEGHDLYETTLKGNQLAGAKPASYF